MEMNGVTADLVRPDSRHTSFAIEVRAIEDAHLDPSTALAGATTRPARAAPFCRKRLRSDGFFGCMECPPMSWMLQQTLPCRDVNRTRRLVRHLHTSHWRVGVDLC